MKQVHENSINCYYQERPKLSKRAKHIHNFFCEKQGLYTDRQVQVEMGFLEPNNVRPRITELIKSGLLEEVGKVKCNVTGKNVRIVKRVI
jgi:predicted transcriptional regulator